jgi:hypothetical protein
MRSRGDGGIPRQEPERTQIRSRSPQTTDTIKRQFRELKQVVTAKALAPKPARRRRRSGEEAAGGFRLSSIRTLRRDTETRTPWDALRAASENADEFTNKPRMNAPQSKDGPMSAGELIAWHLQNGATIEALRAMFPDFFQRPAAAELHWGPPAELDDAQRQQIWYGNDPATHHMDPFNRRPSDHLYAHLEAW